MTVCHLIRYQSAYLALDKDGSEAVEELERGDDVALDEDGCYDGSAGPVARADGHLVEPLLQRELADRTALGPSTRSEHVVHIHGRKIGRTTRSDVWSIKGISFRVGKSCGGNRERKDQG